MQWLHLVGFTDGRRGLVLSSGAGPGETRFAVSIDDALIEHVLATVEPGRIPTTVSAAQQASGPPRSSQLTPKEIQSRLRAGGTVAEVAQEAGVDEAWIDRFAPPVMAERSAAVAAAVAVAMSTPRRGSSDEPLATALVRSLRLRGSELSTAEVESGWDARLLEGCGWVISFTFRTRGRRRQAEWLYDGAAGVLTARSKLAAELGWAAPPAPGVEPPTDVATLAGPLVHRSVAASTTSVARRPVAERGAAAPVAGQEPVHSKSVRPSAEDLAARRAEREVAKRAAEIDRAAARRVAAAERAAAESVRQATRAAQAAAAKAERDASRKVAAGARAAATRARAAEREAARRVARAEQRAALPPPRSRRPAPAAGTAAQEGPPPSATDPAAALPGPGPEQLELSATAGPGRSGGETPADPAPSPAPPGPTPDPASWRQPTPTAAGATKVAPPDPEGPRPQDRDGRGGGGPVPARSAPRTVRVVPRLVGVTGAGAGARRRAVAPVAPVAPVAAGDAHDGRPGPPLEPGPVTPTDPEEPAAHPGPPAGPAPSPVRAAQPPGPRATGPHAEPAADVAPGPGPAFPAPMPEPALPPRPHTGQGQSEAELTILDPPSTPVPAVSAPAPSPPARRPAAEVSAADRQPRPRRRRWRSDRPEAP